MRVDQVLSIVDDLLPKLREGLETALHFAVSQDFEPIKQAFPEVSVVVSLDGRSATFVLRLVLKQPSSQEFEEKRLDS